MSWFLRLYETYDLNQHVVGVFEKKKNGQQFTLLPISHTTQHAHIQVNVTEDGQFHSASVIDKSDANTLIPCAEDSENRAGTKIAPYPLHDKLSYVAGDYRAFGRNEKNMDHFAHYIENLKRWVQSPYVTDSLKSIYRYVSKKQLIQDLIREKILFLDDDGRLIDRWRKKHEEMYGTRPLLFSALLGDQEAAFIRFNVTTNDPSLPDIWKDPDMYDSFIRYYQQIQTNEDVCYVTGKRLPRADKHANKIRSAGDKAKLISANDVRGFTYRGRFSKSSEVASVSYEVSQKAHNALKWLIQRQGRTVDGRVFLAWGNDQLDVPDPMEDSYDLFSKAFEPTPKNSDTLSEFARAVAKIMERFRNERTHRSHVNMLVLDSATTGRMAALYYRNMDTRMYLDKLQSWHSTCVWRHRYWQDRAGQATEFIGAPSITDIALAAYGPRASDHVAKRLMERMLPCIVDEREIPIDIVKSAYYRASNPLSMEYWEWEKTLSVACALINKKEGYDLALDTENNDRDYLFGRLLAVADVLERWALGPYEARSTNAIRYMNAFSQYPERTWKTIQENLQPYQARSGAKVRHLARLIDEIASKFDIGDFNNKPLSGKYLLGFYSQRYELYQKKDNDVGERETG